MSKTSALCVLHIEDAISDFELIRREILNSFPNSSFRRVDTKEDFIDALDSMSADIIISDFSMPGFDGMSALNLRNQFKPDIPFIIVTASNNEEVAVECLKSGANDYLLKDSLLRLNQAIQAALSKQDAQRERKEIRKALRDSEARFQRLVKNAQDLIYRIELIPEIRISFFSDSAIYFTGYDALEFIRKPELLREIIHPDELIVFTEMLSHKETISQPHIYRWIKKDRNVIFVELKNIPIYDDRGQMIAVEGIARDITNYKKALNSVHQREEDLIGLINSMKESIWIFRADGNIIDANVSARLLSGFERNQLLKMKISTFIKDLTINEAEEFLKEDDSFQILLTELQKKDGSCIPIEVNLGIINYFEERVYLIVARDISERIKSNRKIHLLSKAVEYSPIGILILDINRCIEFVNSSFTKISGYTESEMIGKTPDDYLLINENQNERFFQIMWQQILNGKEWTGELRNRKKSGEDFWSNFKVSPIISENHQITHFVVVLEDITDRKNYVREIEEKNSFIQTVLDNLSIGVALNKMDSGEASYVNDKFSEIYGWPREDFRDISTFFDKVYPDETYRNTILNRIMTDIQSGDPSRMHWENIQINQKNGETRIVNAMNIPLFEQNIMVSTVVDVTDLKRYEESLIEAKEKAEESDRLKTAFLANMSHEIRTPMNGILGFIDLLQTPSITPEEQSQYFEVVNQSGQRLLNTINDIIEFSKIEAGEMTAVLEDLNIGHIFTYLYQFFLPQAREKGLRLDYENHLQDKEQVIRTDRHKLEAILVNIIKNALKFTEKGEVVFGVKASENALIFFVRDTGKGIKPSRLAAIFERFVQADFSHSRGYEGSGLGLSIARAYVEILKGKIWADSAVNLGSTFYFTIPFSEGNQINSASIEPDELVRSRPDRSHLILIVEDELNSSMLLKTILNNQGYKIKLAMNGKEALQIIMDNPSIDLILMDIKMPVMDGIEATRKIRELKFKTPVIVQSAHIFKGDIDLAFEAGCNDYITKPISKQDLLQKIDQQLNSAEM